MNKHGNTEQKVKTLGRTNTMTAAKANNEMDISDLNKPNTKMENNESESESDLSSDVDSDYKNDRYSFLEIGRVLELQEPVFSEDEAALLVKNILIGLS